MVVQENGEKIQVKLRGTAIALISNTRPPYFRGPEKGCIEGNDPKRVGSAMLYLFRHLFRDQRTIVKISLKFSQTSSKPFVR